ncbi:hypothetical protein L484_013566 [Morus notabilis]|uniref:Uncharacterized protein n=1 Tax=Morus notabilis TaxID=981085 RepID=W9QET2_9ROSA|nr:hypothetical protein L484_013566 [Morus notabilis]
MTFTKDETLYPDEIFYVIMSSAIADKVLKQSQKLNIQKEEMEVEYWFRSGIGVGFTVGFFWCHY